MISSQIQEINTQYQESVKTTRCGFFEMVANWNLLKIYAKKQSYRERNSPIERRQE